MANIKRAFIGFLALVSIAFYSCSPNEAYNTASNDVANFKFAFGSYAGRLTLFGDSIRSNGDYIFIVQNLDQNDTIIGTYFINYQNNELVGTAVSGYNGVLFSLYPSLDSGYLFEDPLIKLNSMNP